MSSPQTNFTYADGVTSRQLFDLQSQGKKALSEAERISLVKASKSPTRAKPATCERDLSIYEPIVELESLKPVFEANSIGPGRYTVIQYREWSDEYRILTRVETSLTAPPLNDGPRYSDMLTTRGARKITESCYYMATCHGGYKTFVTGTFSQSVREKIAAGRTTIQREVSRTMDSLQKMYQRGWITTDGRRVAGSDKPLAYCWVVEIPKNENGEENPHVHMMVDWRVDQKLFGEWAARIESIWGNGYFHLEKIRDPLCAGAYMAKAAGYMTKGAKQDDQGTVRGNRYGISNPARAPGWYTTTESELGIMGRLITDMNERCQAKYGNLYSSRSQLKKSLENCPKKHKAARRAIGKKLQDVREKINRIPIIASKYQLIFKGSLALYSFLGWAVGAGWSATKRPTSRWLEMFDRKLARIRENRIIRSMRWTDSEWSNAVNDYQQYECFNQLIENWTDCYNHYASASASK